MTLEAGRVRGARAAVLFGLAAAFVAAVDLVRWVRPALLTDHDPAWALPRLLLGLFVLASAAAAGALAAGVFFLARRFLGVAPAPLPLSGAALVFLAAAAIAGGAALRFAALDRIPSSLWIDDVSLIEPALALSGSPRDFADAIRPAPFGVPKAYGSVGVLYLELYRAALLLFGTNVFGVRFVSAAAGAISIVTAMLLARALLPRGGGALAALVFAGLRWSLLLSRWGWNAVVLGPIVDIAALLLVGARRRNSWFLGLLAGLAAGLAAHVYLAAWVAGAALLLFAAWPAGEAARWRPRILLALVFAAGFAVAAAPIFLLARGRAAPYFARAQDHSLLREIGYARSPMPGLAAAADSLVAPWFKEDPHPGQDLPGKNRLGWILGIPVAFALLRSLLRPAEDFSAYLLSQAGAALAASIAGGHAGVPNGYRFAYLATPAAVAAAGGVLCLLALVQARRRRAAALAAVGVIAIGGALSARDALLEWPQRQETFDGFHGQDTLLARSALRWERYGTVEMDPGLGHSPITIGAIRRYRLDPDAAPATASSAVPSRRNIRIAPPGALPGPREHAVERVRDAWGREWGVVIAKSGARSPRS